MGNSTVPPTFPGPQHTEDTAQRIPKKSQAVNSGLSLLQPGRFLPSPPFPIGVRESLQGPDALIIPPRDQGPCHSRVSGGGDKKLKGEDTFSGLPYPGVPSSHSPAAGPSGPWEQSKATENKVGAFTLICCSLPPEREKFIPGQSLSSEMRCLSTHFIANFIFSLFLYFSQSWREERCGPQQQLHIHVDLCIMHSETLRLLLTCRVTLAFLCLQETVS